MLHVAPSSPLRGTFYVAVNTCLVAIQADVELHGVCWHPDDARVILLEEGSEVGHTKVVECPSASLFLLRNSGAVPVSTIPPSTASTIEPRARIHTP